MTWLAGILIAYLVGAIPFGLIVTRIVKRVDVRQFGSGSTGFTNVYRVAGAVPAAAVALLDVAKGLVASTVISSLFYHTNGIVNLEMFRIICGCSAIVGHIYTLFAGFKGGKGVLTGLGVCIGIMPLEAGIALLVFVAVFGVTKFISAGSLAAVVSLPLQLLIERFALGWDVRTERMVLAIVLALIVFLAHLKNIRRLIRGEENRFQRVKV